MNQEGNSCCYQMVYPPLDPPRKKLFLRCVMTTLAPCMAASWAALGGCPGGGGWRESRKNRLSWQFSPKATRFDVNTHGDGDAAAGCEASAGVEAAVHHHGWSMGVNGSHGVVSHGDILAHRTHLHVWLHGHVHLMASVGRGHLRHLTRHLRWKHISGLVYLHTERWKAKLTLQKL